MSTNQQSKTRLKYRSLAEWPQEVIVHQPFTLRVIIESAPEVEDISHLNADLLEIDVYLVVSPYDFSEPDEKLKNLLINKGEKQSYVDFLLTPKQSGKKNILVSFYQSSRYLGELDFAANVVNHYHE